MTDRPPWTNSQLWRVYQACQRPFEMRAYHSQPLRDTQRNRGRKLIDAALNTPAAELREGPRP